MSGRIFHAPFLKVNPHYRVTGVLERTRNLSDGYFPYAKIYRTPEEIWDDADVELVIINTPNATHFDFALHSLQAGKHVVVEKPFTITSREGEILKQIAEEKKLTLAVYHNRRYDSDFRTIQNVLNENQIGTVVEAEIRFDRFRLHPGSKLHKETPGPGTGNLYDLGSHIIDQALVLFGLPEKVFADIQIMREESRVDDYFDITLFYKNQLRVKLHSSYLAAESLPGYSFFGTQGSFIKHKTNIQEDQGAQGMLPDDPSWGVEPEDEKGLLVTLQDTQLLHRKIPSARGNYGTFYEELFSAIRMHTPPPVNAAEAIRVIRLIEKAYESSRSGCVVNF